MNTFFISFVVILALSSTVQAIVCPVDICNGVKCTAVSAETCTGKIVANGGFCGCCDACKTILHQGDNCVMHFIEQGLPAGGVCDDGLFCDISTYKCQQIIV